MGQIYFDDNASSVIFRNNIVYSTGATQEYWTESGSGSPTCSDNLYYGNGGKPDFDNGEDTLNENPDLTAVGSEDFTLTSDSPCIDVGYDTSGTVAYDLDVLARPINSTMDMGAYEYNPGSAPEGTSTAFLRGATLQGCTIK